MSTHLCFSVLRFDHYLPGSCIQFSKDARWTVWLKACILVQAGSHSREDPSRTLWFKFFNQCLVSHIILLEIFLRRNLRCATPVIYFMHNSSYSACDALSPCFVNEGSFESKICRLLLSQKDDLNTITSFSS